MENKKLVMYQDRKATSDMMLILHFMKIRSV